MAATMYFNTETTDTELQQWLIAADPGDIVVLRHGFEYEDFLQRVADIKEEERQIEVLYVSAGHPLFTEYGANCLVVKVNTI